MKRFLPALLCCAAAFGQPLRDLAAQRGIRLGAAVTPSYFSETPYSDTLAREFSQVEPENDMKFGPIHPSPTSYNWTNADQIVSFAVGHNMAIRGHALVWHQQNPSWLNGLDPKALAAALQDHIRTVVGRYSGKVYAWDVVNEAFNDNGTLRSTIWSDSPGIGQSGTAYIEQALRWAHEADPAALLFYNDYSAEAVNAKSDAIYKMVQAFRARGVPIDGVGMQMHLTGSAPNLPSIEANIKRLTDLGLQVQITELDVRLTVDSAGNATAAALAAQATIYGDVVALCLKFPGCTAVQTWGITDKHSWIPGAFAGFGAGLPFDTSYNPKPARDAIASALQSSPPVISASGLVNAASYAGGSVAPGEIFVLFGATYGPAEIGAGDTVRVLFDGIPAPVLYARVGQAGAVAPFDLTGKTSTTVQYEYLGIRSNPVTVPVNGALPGLFTLDASGRGPGAILNAATFDVVSTAKPVAAEDYLAIFATGIGANPAKVSATIGGVSCPVLYAGAAPGLVAGAAQINTQVPAGVAPGDQSVVVTVDGVSSQPGVTVRIR